MNQVITIDNKLAKDLLSTIRELKEQVVRLNEKLEGAPPYGSDEWEVLIILKPELIFITDSHSKLKERIFIY